MTNELRGCIEIGDVGGQKTLRSYWRNYFEKTDALIWVVDATDRLRIDDCREELHGLLQEEVCLPSTCLLLMSRTQFLFILSTQALIEQWSSVFQVQVCWCSLTRPMCKDAWTRMRFLKDFSSTLSGHTIGIY